MSVAEVRYWLKVNNKENGDNNMNKGMKIRNKKLRRNLSKRNKIKPDQENICRFIEIKYQVIERINGKFRHTGSNKDKGLQIRNRVYLLNGHYKPVNNKGLKITKVYDDIPEWSDDNLRKKYEEFLSKQVS